MATTSDLRPCSVALVRVPLGDHGAAVAVEKRLAASVRRIDARYKADPRSKSYPIRKSDTGAYNCRKVGGSSSWSKHAYGAAVDVNWSTNGYGARTYDLPAWYVALWRAEGWGWGGNWTRVKDWMHFSKFPNEGGDGKLEGTASAPPPVAPKPTPTPQPASAPKWPNVLLRRGSKGTHVRTYQARMKARGWRIAVDGDFGPQTDRVTRAFQKEKRLVVDGLVGRVTWDRAFGGP